MGALVIETKVTAQNSFDQNHLWMEGNHLILGIFADSWPVPEPLDRERRMSTFPEHFLFFAIFKPLSVPYKT